MCNNYRLRVELGTIGQDFSHIRIPLLFPEGLPNLEPRDDIRITDRAPIVRIGAEGRAELVQRQWSWKGTGGKPVYNYRSEGRQFGSGRCLIPADGFYEFTDPPADGPKSRLKCKWLFTKADEPWFCIAGLWRASDSIEAFTMLTVDPGPDVAPYHSRQIVVLDRKDWSRWLDPAVPAAELLRPSPPGSLRAERVR